MNPVPFDQNGGSISMPNNEKPRRLADCDFFTVKQVAEKLKISKSMVYRLIAIGELVCHAFGSRKLVLDTDLESYCASKRVDIPRLPTARGRHF